jgi:hypothetical protein
VHYAIQLNWLSGRFRSALRTRVESHSSSGEVARGPGDLQSSTSPRRYLVRPGRPVPVTQPSLRTAEDGAGRSGRPGRANRVVDEYRLLVFPARTASLLVPAERAGGIAEVCNGVCAP